MPSSSSLIAFSASVSAILAVEIAVRVRLAEPLAKLRAASTRSLSTIADKDLTDDEKSELVLACSKDILVASLGLLWRIMVILGVFLVVFLGAGSLTGTGMSPYWDALGTWWVQAVIVAVAMLFLWGRLSVSRRL